METRIIATSPKIRTLVFLSCLLVLSAFGYYFAINRNSPWTSLLVMWSPGLAAILAGLIVSRRLTDFGLRLGALKYLPAAWLLPIFSALLVYGIAWGTGLETAPSPLFLKRAAATLHLTGAWHTEIVLRAFLYISTMGLLNLGALGEELGWRGYLFPELNRWLGFQRAALVSGIIWALWHWPLIMWGHYSSGIPLSYALLCITVMTASSGVWFAWFRLKSGSIWPCFILHSVHTAVIQKFFDRITLDHGYGKYFTTEFGAGLALTSLGLACWIWSRSRQADERPMAISGIPPHEVSRASGK